jgi:hypothetical protein
MCRKWKLARLSEGELSNEGLVEEDVRSSFFVAWQAGWGLLRMSQ